MLVLDWDAMSSLSDATQALYSARYDSTWGDVCYTKVSLTSTGVTLAEGPSNSTSLTLGAANVEDGKAVVTYTFGGGNTKTLTLYALDVATGTLASTSIETGWEVSAAFDRLTVDTASGAVERAIVFNTALSSTEILALSTSVIPEPTTATLSLLALAGLAARRRRK